jgi:DNA-binding CsgD family transcriptional regulator
MRRRLRVSGASARLATVGDITRKELHVSVPELSPIEEQVVLRVAGGQTTSAIAGELRLSLKTVAWHLARARQKLERAATLLDRVEAAERP